MSETTTNKATETTTVTDEQIEALRQEAGQAGDSKQIELCDAALRGNDRARSACASAISDAAARS